MKCKKCNSANVDVEKKEGRGIPPKGWVRKPGDRRLISWKGMWNIYMCNDCGETWKELIH